MSPSNARFKDGTKLLLGVVHLRPLPGSPRHGSTTPSEILEWARADAETLLAAGFDGYVLENFGDVPFHPGPVEPTVVAWMTRIAADLPGAGSFRVVNVLRNDASAALAVASATGCDAIRINVHCGAMVTDQGIVEGRAAETLRLRETVAPGVAILADVAVKHATPLGAGFSLEESARDTAYRGLADALIVTGPATGRSATPHHFDVVRSAVPDRPILVGSGVDASTISQWYEAADGIIVGTALKRGGRVDERVDPERAKRLVEGARG